MDSTTYTQEAAFLLKKGSDLAIKNENLELTNLHILYSILDDEGTRVSKILLDLGLPLKLIKDDLDQAIKKIKVA